MLRFRHQSPSQSLTLIWGMAGAWLRSPLELFLGIPDIPLCP